MKRVVLLATLLAVSAAGCKQSPTPGTASQRDGSDLNGAGATFPYPVYSKWFADFGKAHPGTHINYQSIGSGGGIRQVGEGTVDFGATDGPMSDKQIANARIKVLHIPTVLGAVVPVYNLPGVTGDLNFAPDVLAGIFLGTIGRWSDPLLARDNPGVHLPDAEILPIYRSDGSGTTFIFTDFLSKTSPEWSSRVGRSTSVRWPVGVGQKGSEGVAGMVRQSPFSIGYVELNYAAQNRMAFGAVRNSAGKFVKGSMEAVTAAAAATAATLPADLRVSITNPPGEASYPIASFTWLLIPVRSDDPAKGRTLVDFLHWMLDHGEAEAARMGYAPLPKEVQDRIRQISTQIQ